MSLDINDVHQGASHQLSLHRNLRYEWEWWGKREGILLLLLPPELSRQIVSTDHKQNRMNKPNEQTERTKRKNEGERKGGVTLEVQGKLWGQWSPRTQQRG